MKRILVLAVILVLAASGAFAATSSSDTHSVTMNVAELTAILVLGDVTLDLQAPVDAGDPPAGDVDTTAKLAYTIVGVGGDETITVGWLVTDEAPAGTLLRVLATTMGTDYGTAAAEVEFVNLDATAYPFIGSISSCFTTTAGVPTLRYTYVVDDPTLLEVGDNQTVTIQYTLATN